MSFCTKCGFQSSNGEAFCSKCGTKLLENSQAVSTQSVSASSNSYMQNEAEKELYTKNLIGYYKGPRQITGTFLVTNKKFSYKPLGMYLLDKPFTINMSEIADVERASVLGINLCVRITTTSGKSHIFGFGIQNKNDIQVVIDLINSVKQGGRH